MAPLKVLIVGGGIAGPALAHWLLRVDADVTIIERSPQMRASGQQVDIRAQGVQMIKKMGIEAAIRAASVPETRAQLVDRSGRTKAFFPAIRSGTGKQSSHRSTRLCAVIWFGYSTSSSRTVKTCGTCSTLPLTASHRMTRRIQTARCTCASKMVVWRILTSSLGQMGAVPRHLG